MNQKRIDAWNSNDLPIFEPNLFNVAKLPRDGSADRQPNLFFTTDVERAIAEADVVFVSVNTPTKFAGIGAGFASDISWVELAVRTIAEVSTTDKIIVEKSTVPCRTAESIRDILAANGRPGVRFDVLSNPEFLAEGTAMNDLLHPDRILIGSLPNDEGYKAASSLVDMYAEWVPRNKIITMNLWSSELAKLAANALLAQRISSINALGAVCEAVGAEIDEVAFAVGLDRRIGPHMLKSSVGFGGSCFKKDVLNLVYLSETLHLPEVAAYWKAVVDINEWQKDRFAKRVVSTLYNTITNKRVAILGFAYKKNTGDTRESAAITIVRSLIAERAQISIYDPEVKADQIWDDLGDTPAAHKQVTICKNAYDACSNAHAVVILTEWDEFKVSECTTTDVITPVSSAPPSPVSMDGEEKNLVSGINSEGAHADRPKLNWARVAKMMQKPMFVFDGRNIVDPHKLEALGFRVQCIGNGRFGMRQ